MAHLAAVHSTRASYMDDARKDLDEARAFVQAKQLLTLPAVDNLQVIPTPDFMRGGYPVGGFNPAPPLEPQLGAFYWITPIPGDWAQERVDSKLREYNFLQAETAVHPRGNAGALRADGSFERRAATEPAHFCARFSATIRGI